MKQFLTLTTLTLVMVFGTVVSVRADDAQTVRDGLAEILPDTLNIEEITPSPMEHVFEVKLSGGQDIYVTVNGKFLMIGDVYDTARNVNLADERRSQEMVTAIGNLPMDEMIVFGPKDAKRHVTIFTDIDCGYCRKLHREVPELNDAGLQVRYLMFPRAGLQSESYKTAVSVWCADDSQKAITMAKQGNSVEPLSCDNPIADQYKLGQKVGVRGTPTMILDDGSVIPGYLPSDQLLARLNINN